MIDPFVAFIRGLLENVGPEINPIRLIRRIKNGLEIPGLKEALIKILQAFNLQISLLEGCQTILDGDSAELAKGLHKSQSRGFFESGKCRSCVAIKELWDVNDNCLCSGLNLPDLRITTTPKPDECYNAVPVPPCCPSGMCKWRRGNFTAA